MNRNRFSRSFIATAVAVTTLAMTSMFCSSYAAAQQADDVYFDGQYYRQRPARPTPATPTRAVPTLAAPAVPTLAPPRQVQAASQAYYQNASQNSRYESQAHYTRPDERSHGEMADELLRSEIRSRRELTAAPDMSRDPRTGNSQSVDSPHLRAARNPDYVTYPDQISNQLNPPFAAPPQLPGQQQYAQPSDQFPMQNAAEMAQELVSPFTSAPYDRREPEPIYSNPSHAMTSPVTTNRYASPRGRYRADSNAPKIQDPFGQVNPGDQPAPSRGPARDPFGAPPANQSGSSPGTDPRMAVPPEDAQTDPRMTDPRITDPRMTDPRLQERLNQQPRNPMQSPFGQREDPVQQPQQPFGQSPRNTIDPFADPPFQNPRVRDPQLPDGTIQVPEVPPEFQELPDPGRLNDVPGGNNGGNTGDLFPPDNGTNGANNLGPRDSGYGQNFSRPYRNGEYRDGADRNPYGQDPYGRDAAGYGPNSYGPQGYGNQGYGPDAYGQNQNGYGPDQNGQYPEGYYPNANANAQSGYQQSTPVAPYHQAYPGVVTDGAGVYQQIVVAPECNSCNAFCNDFEYESGFYLSLFAGGSQIGVLREILDAPGDPQSNFDFDTGGVYGVALGSIQGRNLRTELEFSYRNYNLNGINSTPDRPVLDGNGELNTYTGMANAYWEFVNYNSYVWKPYVGGGIGFMFIEPNLLDGAAPITENNGNDSTFAYQLMAGLNYKYRPNADLFIEYRYLAAEDIRFEVAGIGDPKFDLNSDNILFGVKLKF